LDSPGAAAFENHCGWLVILWPESRKFSDIRRGLVYRIH